MISPIQSLVIPAECPAHAGRRAGTYMLQSEKRSALPSVTARRTPGIWVPDLRPAQGRASVRDDNGMPGLAGGAP